MTTQELIFAYLKRRMSEGISIISSHHIEGSMPEYGKVFWQTSRLPSAYSRSWRRIRERKEYTEIGIKDVREIKNKNSREKTWEMIT